MGTLSNKKINQSFIIFSKILLAGFLVLLISCPVKAGLKSFTSESSSFFIPKGEKPAVQNQSIECSVITDIVHLSDNFNPQLLSFLLLASVLLGVFVLVKNKKEHQPDFSFSSPLSANTLYLKNRMLLI